MCPVVSRKVCKALRVIVLSVSSVGGNAVTDIEMLFVTCRRGGKIAGRYQLQ